MTTLRAAFDRATLAFAIVLVAATWAHLWILQLNPIGLGVDEAQYWMWSQRLDWGYFTKPPLVAWVIAATTTLFGDAEWAVRLGAPLLQGLASIAIFALARSMFGAWAGFWAGLSWLVMPGVFFSSNLISTDAALLPMWSLALLALWRMVMTRAWVWAVVLGLTFGVGVLAKYAMLYFIPCLALAAWRQEPVRQALAQGRGVVAGLIGLAIVTPNLVWNAQNGFATVEHTATNARLVLTDMFNFDELFEYLTSQAAVLGPIFFIALIWLLFRAARRGDTLPDHERLLGAFVLPPLIIVCLIAFISRAHANWAAVAYPASIVWVAGVLFSSSVAGRRILAAAAVINMMISAGFTFVSLDRDLSVQFKGVRMARAWDETAHEIARRAVAQPGDPPFTAVLVDDRDTYFLLNYYWRDLREAGAPLPPLRMWLMHGSPHNSAEATDPMRTAEGGRVLVVHLTPAYLPLVAEDFTVFRTVEHLSVPLGGGRSRELEISVGERFAPLPRDAAWEERLRSRNLQ